MNNLDWLKEIEYEDIIMKHEYASLVYEYCDFEVFCALWTKMLGINIYVAEKVLFELKARYIRKFFNRDDRERNAKALALKLGVSEQFVYETLQTTDKKDDRQGSLL